MKTMNYKTSVYEVYIYGLLLFIKYIHTYIYSVFKFHKGLNATQQYITCRNLHTLLGSGFNTFRILTLMK